MGKEVALSFSGSDWILLTLIGGMIMFIIGLFWFLSGLNSEQPLMKKPIALALIGFVLMTYGSVYVNSNYDEPSNGASYEKAVSQLGPIKNAYTTQKFYLKESVSEPGPQGKLQGNASGFLFVSGNVYGSIDSKRVVTVVYKDDDSVIDPQVGVYRSISYSLDEVAIVTIESSERPYLMYPEAKVFIEKNGNLSQLKLIPGVPYLYFPDGWKVL